MKGIFVEGRYDPAGKGYFQAFLEEESANGKPLDSAVCSTSRKGFFIAAANLCKRLANGAGPPFPATPAKWQIYSLLESGPKPIVDYGYLLVEKEESNLFFAHLMLPPLLVEEAGPEELEEYVAQGWLNSMEEASGQSGYGALANLCRKFAYNGYGTTYNSIILDPLTAAFFLPVARDNSA